MLFGRKRCRWTRTRTCWACQPKPNWTAKRRPPSGGHLCPGFGRTSHENVIKPRRALSCRYPVNCIVVRPERYGNVANRNRLRPAASQHHGPSAEAGGKATSAAAGGTHGCTRRPGRSPAACNTIDFARCHTGGAGYNHGEACRVRENLQQLQRWLPNKFQVRQPTLEWMLGVGGGFRLLFRQRAETYTTTKPMLSARTPDCFWVGTTLAPGGIAAACSPEGSWPGRRRFRSPNSSEPDVASPYRPLAAQVWPSPQSA